MSEYILFIMLYKFIGDIHHKLRSMVNTDDGEEKQELDIGFLLFLVGLIALLLVWHFYGKIDTGDTFD